MIEVNNLIKNFGSFRALNGVNMHVGTGSYNYSDNEYRSRTTTQNYLEGGDTYGLNKTQSRTKSRLYQLSAAFSIHPKGLIVNGSSSFSFSQNHAFSQSPLKKSRPSMSSELTCRPLIFITPFSSVAPGNWRMSASSMEPSESWKAVAS